MECPTPCDCGETVELNSMRSCSECGDLYCEACVDDGYCEGCRVNFDECVECGDMIPKGTLEKGGVCYPCKETMV